MLLESIWRAITLLTYWEIWACGIIYSAIILLPSIYVFLIYERNEGLGCATRVLVPAFQVFGLFVFLLILSPIIFGLSDYAQWSWPWKLLIDDPLVALKAVGILIGVAIVADIFMAFYSLRTLELGGLVLVWALLSIHKVYPYLPIEQVDFVPSFWVTVGICAVGAVVQWLATMGSIFLAATFNDDSDTDYLILISQFNGAVAGTFPALIYGSWIGIQLKALS